MRALQNKNINLQKVYLRPDLNVAACHATLRHSPQSPTRCFLFRVSQPYNSLVTIPQNTKNVVSF